MTRLVLAAFFASAALSACSHTAIEAHRHDKRLVDELARASMAGIAAGNLAVIRGETPEVKRLGERMVEDHSRLLRAASGLAASRGTSIPATPGARYQPALKQLESLPDAGFDQAFLARTARQQEEARQLLLQAAAQTGDAQLREQVLRALARVEEHRAAARRTASLD